MRWKRVLIIGIALFGLLLLPLTALAYWLLYLKGAPIKWAALDLQHLDLNAFLVSLGVDLPDLSLDHLLNQVANASERANNTGSPGGVVGGTGGATGGGVPARPNDPLERQKEKYEKRLKEKGEEMVDKIWEEIKDALNMKPLPPDSSSGKSSGKK